MVFTGFWSVAHFLCVARSCQCLLKQDQEAEELRQIAGLSQAEEALLDKQRGSWGLLKPGAEDGEGLRQPCTTSRSATPMTSGCLLPAQVTSVVTKAGPPAKALWTASSGLETQATLIPVSWAWPCLALSACD